MVKQPTVYRAGDGIAHQLMVFSLSSEFPMQLVTVCFVHAVLPRISPEDHVCTEVQIMSDELVICLSTKKQVLFYRHPISYFKAILEHRTSTQHHTLSLVPTHVVNLPEKPEPRRSKKMMFISPQTESVLHMDWTFEELGLSVLNLHTGEPKNYSQVQRFSLSPWQYSVSIDQTAFLVDADRCREGQKPQGGQFKLMQYDPENGIVSIHSLKLPSYYRKVWLGKRGWWSYEVDNGRGEVLLLSYHFKMLVRFSYI